MKKKNLFLEELFESKLEFTVKFKNLTSDTKLDKEVKMLEVMDDGCGLEVPVRCCALAHQVHLVITLTNPEGPKKKTLSIEAVGKIISFEPVDEKHNEIVITFNQYVKDEWNHFTKYLQARQDFIVELSEKLKKLG